MKKYRLRLFIYLVMLISIASVLSLSCFGIWKQIINNRKTKEELLLKYDQLLEKEETLEGEVVKLQDPEYVAKYAREKYLFTKDGELIIDMSKAED